MHYREHSGNVGEFRAVIRYFRLEDAEDVMRECNFGLKRQKS